MYKILAELSQWIITIAATHITTNPEVVNQQWQSLQSVNVSDLHLHRLYIQEECNVYF